MTSQEYECACGETFTNLNYATDCRKCRHYSPAGYCSHVTSNGVIVWGEYPSDDEIHEHCDRQREAEAKLEIEIAEWNAVVDAELAKATEEPPY